MTLKQVYTVYTLFLFRNTVGDNVQNNDIQKEGLQK